MFIGSTLYFTIIDSLITSSPVRNKVWVLLEVPSLLQTNLCAVEHFFHQNQICTKSLRDLKSVNL